jgi:2'-hydroxyisoflavone reductase
VRTRRDFVKLTAAMGGALGAGLIPLGTPVPAAQAAPATRPSARPLRVLLLGGTGFIGPHLVRTLLEHGHTPTLFNRGRSQPELFPELFPGLENLIGDRNDDISSLRGRSWDAVIDDSGYTPPQVSAMAQLLRGNVGQYLFTSTRGVYTNFTPARVDEDAPIGMAGLPPEQWTGYGPLKAAAELELRRILPDNTTIVRPSIITGPGDNTDRFTYWYVRIHRGGEVLAPGAQDDPIQYIDVRDLADFYVNLLEQRTFGTFNLVAPAAPLNTAEFLYGIRATTATPVRFTWIDWDFLESQGLRGGQQLAAWRPPVGDNLNYGRVDNSRSIAAGLTFRPLAVTAYETREWWLSRQTEADARIGSGPPPDREAAVLAAWHARAR